MKPIEALIRSLSAAEDAFTETPFLAPCVPGGKVRVRIAGLVRTFVPHPSDYEGWGIFQARQEGTARLTEEATLPQIGDYLARLPTLRAYLAHPLKGRTWLAYPANEADMRQRKRAVKPFAVHLVEDGSALETVIVRIDGGHCWFEDADRRADPEYAERLKEDLKAVTPPGNLRFKGLTPEMRAAYDLASQQCEAFKPILRHQTNEERLREALRMGGGNLRDVRDRGEHWLVEWTTRDGERHTSAIQKNDLTVLSAGICLSGEDRKFDLQSLVGVVEGQLY
jgi:hypothetical protein